MQEHRKDGTLKGSLYAGFLSVKNAHHTERPKEGGFALALSLALLSFLALLILALVALIGVEARVAESTRSHRLAREHAKVAMRIALGELKEHLGPDRRISARADFLDDPEDSTIEGAHLCATA